MVEKQQRWQETKRQQGKSRKQKKTGHSIEPWGHIEKEETDKDRKWKASQEIEDIEDSGYHLKDKTGNYLIKKKSKLRQNLNSPLAVQLAWGSRILALAWLQDSGKKKVYVQRDFLGVVKTSKI